MEQAFLQLLYRVQMDEMSRASDGRSKNPLAKFLLVQSHNDGEEGLASTCYYSHLDSNPHLYYSSKYPLHFDTYEATPAPTKHGKIYPGLIGQFHHARMMYKRVREDEYFEFWSPFREG